jgi:mannose-6-phosphate isomerase-like protein (cupin superfamily)
MINHFRTAAYCASILALTLANPAWAQMGGTSSPKTLVENDKVLVSEITAKPGDTTASVKRQGQAYYYVQGGSLELTYDDGTKANVVRKTGQAIIVTEKRAYSAKNTGTTNIHVITVTLK